MGLRMKNFNTSGVYRKIPFLGLEVHKSRGGIAAKGGGRVWTVFRFKGWAWQGKGGGGVFEDGLIPQFTLWHYS